MMKFDHLRIADPDGYLVRLWDERSMKEKQEQ